MINHSHIKVQCSVDSWLCADDSGEDEEEQACGTTATVVLVRKDKIVVANVGDSRAVLSRHGRALDLSTEHRYSCMQNQGHVLNRDLHCQTQKSKVPQLGLMQCIVDSSSSCNYAKYLKSLAG